MTSLPHMTNPYVKTWLNIVLLQCFLFGGTSLIMDKVIPVLPEANESLLKALQWYQKGRITFCCNGIKRSISNKHVPKCIRKMEFRLCEFPNWLEISYQLETSSIQNHPTGCWNTSHLNIPLDWRWMTTSSYWKGQTAINNIIF